MGETGDEKGLEEGETDGGVEEKAEEVGEGGGGDAVVCPRAVMVHFWDAPRSFFC